MRLRSLSADTGEGTACQDLTISLQRNCKDIIVRVRIERVS